MTFPPLLLGSGLWRKHWLWSSRVFAAGNHDTAEQGTTELSIRKQNTQYKPTWIDKTEERVAGGEAAVPLEPPIGATTRPLDGQNLWLQWALSMGTIQAIIRAWFLLKLLRLKRLCLNDLLWYTADSRCQVWLTTKHSLLGFGFCCRKCNMWLFYSFNYTY